MKKTLLLCLAILIAPIAFGSVGDSVDRDLALKDPPLGSVLHTSAQTTQPAQPNLPAWITPFRSFSGQFVGVTSTRWAAVLATPYASWPVAPFKLFGHTVTGVSLNADILAGAIFSGGQFTAGDSFDGHYSWHPNDFVGAGIAQLYSSSKPIYRPFVEIGWQF